VAFFTALVAVFLADFLFALIFRCLFLLDFPRKGWGRYQTRPRFPPKSVLFSNLQKSLKNQPFSMQA
jgi:hypothetical protein